MESMEYEEARNMTLLFFLERLLDRGEPRTLHDLSCQFGARGFTKEMRQIAGGSQSGKVGPVDYYLASEGCPFTRRFIFNPLVVLLFPSPVFHHSLSDS
ncbi:egalitarian [Anopheles sinensis]|uniref:Egalitarian n=1 Tax=Anopheles sinensis TaxID=74873 RepID=A0A084W2F2_ANOSI|nr:egalitarian [Anopheles sinensis]